MSQASYTFFMLAAAAAFFVGMVGFMEAGRRLGVRQFAKRGEASRSGVGVVDGAIFGLLSLLMGFTFSGAAARFDHRRDLVIKEVSSASTTWERIAVLPHELESPVRERLRAYVDAVLAANVDPPGSEAEERDRLGLAVAQDDLWHAAVSATSAPGGDVARMLLLPSLNEMFGAVETERLSQRVHPSPSIWVMLVLIAMAAALFGGYRMAAGTTRNWIPVLGVAAAMSVALFVILELESPRLGLVRIDGMDKALVELRATME